MAVYASRDAVVYIVTDWARAFMRGLHAMGYVYTTRCDALMPVDVANLALNALLILDAPALHEWEGAYWP